MRVLKVLLIAAVAMVMLLAGVLLTVNNQQQIAIDLVFVQLPEASVSRWLVLSFLSGVILSLLIGGVALVVMKARLRHARRAANQSERELDKLKTLQLNQSL
ncbi:MAG: lipopolysaccharide assembly protein LapA domain-containing protein [Halopseudomonas sp.]